MIDELWREIALGVEVEVMLTDMEKIAVRA